MKKIIILIIALGGLGGLIYFAMDLSEKQGTSVRELINFEIEDVSTVDKIIITDKFDRKFTLVKKGSLWTGKNGGCISQGEVDHLLDAFKNIGFKGYLNDKSKQKFTDIMSAQHIKVEIFQKGEWSKTWFIGPASKDHLGQIMLLDTKENGKSKFPVVMEMKNMKGIIDPRFHADPLQWKCSDLISLKLTDISYIDVKFNDEKSRGFKVTKKGNNMKVYQKGKELLNVDPTMIYNYLSNFQDINYNVANYELNRLQMDSLKRTTPFCELTVKGLKSKKETFKLYRIVTSNSDVIGNAEIMDMDIDRLWCQIPTGELVKCQYFVFNPLIFGHLFFPQMDLSDLTTHDGINPIE